jgi:hypothetical protein
MATRRLEMHPTLGLAMGTLNTCVFVLLGLLLIYLSADLGDVLDGLSTGIGLAVFALLWSVTCFCTYRGFEEAGAAGSRFFSASVKWGAFNGLIFYLALLGAVLAVTIAGALVEGNGDAAAGIIVFGVVAVGAGTILSSAIGLVFGIVFASLDMLLLNTARMLVGERT